MWKDPDYLTLRFDSGGTLQWARTFSGPHGDWGFDAAADIAVRTSGGCRVTGNSADLTYMQSYERCGTVAYSATGEEEWSIRFWQVFPFDFSAYDFGWGTLVRWLLGLAIFGIGVGMLVQLAQLARLAGIRAAKGEPGD